MGRLTFDGVILAGPGHWLALVDEVNTQTHTAKVIFYEGLETLEGIDAAMEKLVEARKSIVEASVETPV